MLSVIFIACFIVFIVMTETVKGWKLSFLQKISFSTVPLSILSYDLLASKFGGVVVPMLVVTIWFALGMAVLLVEDYARKHPEEDKEEK